MIVPSLASNTSTPTTTVSDADNDVVANDSIITDVTNDVVADVTNDVVADVTNDVVADVTNDVVADVTNDVVADVTNDVVTDVTNDVVANDSIITDVTSDVVVPTPHTCTIDYATENYHRFSCEECDNYSRIYHNEETMNVLVKNDFFHIWECKDCGYEYAEKHNFSTTYTTTSHQEVCEDCGYAQPAEAHEMINDFWSNYHDIMCDYCGFTEAHHVGIKYEAIDENSCQATCSCGVVEIIEHDWNGFVCDNCNHVMSGSTYAIVGRISKNEDDYRVRFITNNGTHRVNMWDVTGFEEGDFVKITHHGNDIFTVSVMIEEDVICDEENFKNYTSSSIITSYYPMDNLTFEDLIIENVEFFDNLFEVEFDRLHATFYYDYQVFDLRNSEMGILLEGDAVLYFTDNSTVYFIIIW